MLKAFRQWLIRVLTAPAPDTASNTHAVEDVPYRSTTSIVPYDENLLERSRTQWQFGDWVSLAALDRDTLQHHPDRAKLALLAAAGHAQQGQGEQARQFTRLAQDWGCSKKLISQVLISGVHNTLGRAAASGGQQARALQHFGNAIAIGSPGSETTLLAQARTTHQVQQLGLPPATQTPNIALGSTRPAANPTPGTTAAKPQRPPEERTAYLNKNGETLYQAGQYKLAVEYFQSALALQPQNAWICQNLAEEIHQAWQVGNWGLLAKLDNADLAGQPSRATLALYAACGHQQLDDMEGLQRCSRLAQDWGCPREQLKQYLAAGIRNTLAISDSLVHQYEGAAKSYTDALTVGRAKPNPQIIKSRIRRQLKTLKNIDAEQVFDAIAKHLH